MLHVYTFLKEYVDFFNNILMFYFVNFQNVIGWIFSENVM